MGIIRTPRTIRSSYYSFSAKQKSSTFAVLLFCLAENSNSQEFVIIRGFSRVIIVAQQLIIIRFLKSEFEKYIEKTFLNKLNGLPQKSESPFGLI